MTKHFHWRGVLKNALSWCILKRNCQTNLKTFLAESLLCLQWDVALQAVILHEKRWDINVYDPLIMVMIKSTSMNLVNVLVRFNQLLWSWYFCSLPRIQYRHPPSHLPSQKKKKKSAVSKTLFFSFHLHCCENENLWWFSPYPVTTTMIWPTTDRIPHSSIFKRMQIKRIVDNVGALFFLIDKLEQRTWRKENLSFNQVFSQVGE